MGSWNWADFFLVEICKIVFYTHAIFLLSVLVQLCFGSILLMKLGKYIIQLSYNALNSGNFDILSLV